MTTGCFHEVFIIDLYHSMDCIIGICQSKSGCQWFMLQLSHIYLYMACNRLIYLRNYLYIHTVDHKCNILQHCSTILSCYSNWVHVFIKCCCENLTLLGMCIGPNTICLLHAMYPGIWAGGLRELYAAYHIKYRTFWEQSYMYMGQSSDLNGVRGTK